MGRGGNLNDVSTRCFGLKHCCIDPYVYFDSIAKDNRCDVGAVDGWIWECRIPFLAVSPVCCVSSPPIPPPLLLTDTSHTGAVNQFCRLIGGIALPYVHPKLEWEWGRMRLTYIKMQATSMDWRLGWGGDGASEAGEGQERQLCG